MSIEGIDLCRQQNDEGIATPQWRYLSNNTTRQDNYRNRKKIRSEKTESFNRRVHLSQASFPITILVALNRSERV